MHAWIPSPPGSSVQPKSYARLAPWSYVAPSAGTRKSTWGGVRSRTVYVAVAVVVRPSKSVAVTLNVWDPAFVVSISEPSGWLPSHETTKEVSDEQKNPNCTFAPCGR